MSTRLFLEVSPQYVIVKWSVVVVVVCVCVCVCVRAFAFFVCVRVRACVCVVSFYKIKNML